MKYKVKYFVRTTNYIVVDADSRDNAAALVERGGQGDFDMGDAVPIEDELEVYGVEEVE